MNYVAYHILHFVNEHLFLSIFVVISQFFFVLYTLKQLNDLLTEALAESLPHELTLQISRVVTHALVPTLSLALSHTSDQV